MSIVQILRNFVTTFYMLIDADSINKAFYSRSIRTLIRLFNFAYQVIVKKNVTKRPDMDRILFHVCMDHFANRNRPYNVFFFQELNELCKDIKLASDAVDLYNQSCEELDQIPEKTAFRKIIHQFIE